MRWDREVDVLVFGAGMGGMCAALIAAHENLDVLLCEKTDQVGGTTSTSAGTVWIPGSSQAKRDGVPDSIDDARRFLEAEIGPRALGQREAFLEAGPAALDYLEARTEVKFRAPPRHPDYHSNQPGRALAGRALAPLPFDGRLLGQGLRARAAADRAVHGARRHDGRQGRHPGAAEAVRFAQGIHGGRQAAAAPRGRPAALPARHAAGDGQRAGRRGCSTACAPATCRSHSMRGWSSWCRGSDRVEGAVVDIGDKRQTIRARRGVILATGGFAPSEKLRAEFMHGRAGRALQRVRRARAATDLRRRARPARRWTTRHTSPAFYFPSSLHKETVYPHILLDRAKPGLIAVNSDGRRFVNESDSYHDFVEGDAARQCRQRRACRPG